MSKLDELLKHYEMKTTLDEILAHYENTKSTDTQEIPRQETMEETELLTDYVLNGNVQSIFDYYELKDKLDKEWIDREMYHQKFPW